MHVSNSLCLWCGHGGSIQLHVKNTVHKALNYFTSNCSSGIFFKHLSWFLWIFWFIKKVLDLKSTTECGQWCMKDKLALRIWWAFQNFPGLFYSPALTWYWQWKRANNDSNSRGHGKAGQEEGNGAVKASRTVAPPPWLAAAFWAALFS